MTATLARLGLAILVVGGCPAIALAEANAPQHAIGEDVTYSTDADQTDVLRVGSNLDWLYRGPDHYLGVRLESITYRLSGEYRTVDERVYVRAADAVGKWIYHASVGTDGRTVVGSASINNARPLRKEFFVERDRVETPLGVTRPIYYTFGGGTIDLPITRQTQLTLLGGVQKFTGQNVRTHLRANLIQVLKEDWGLSAQLRTRYSHNSVPSEFDYFSPRWYAEVVPVLQLRRFVSGWRYLAAIGLGMQRDSRSDWRQSRYLNFRVSSPASRRGWIVNAEATYSNTPITNRNTYDYLRASMGITRAF